MKSKDLEKLVLWKCESGDSATKKIFRDLCGAISRWTIFNWCKIQKILGQNKFQKRRHIKNFVFWRKNGWYIDGVYNAQNDRVWTVDLGEADRKGG